MRDMTKKLNIFTLIRIGNLDWCKCRRCKNEAREIDCLGCREVDAMLIASTIVTRARGNHLAVRDLWATARLLVTRVSLIYLVDWFFFFSLVYLNDQGGWGETDSLIQGQMKLHLFSAGILAKAIMTHSDMLYRLYFSTFCFHEPLLFQIFALGNFYENLGLPMSTHLIPRAIFKKCAGDEVGVYYHFYNQHPCR